MLRNGRRAPRFLWSFAALLVMIVLTPITVVLAHLFDPAEEVWAHVGPQLPGLIANTCRLVAGVAGGTGLLGMALAWLTARCEFPGRRVFDWALALPLSIPAYVQGFVLIGLLDYSGPVQIWWRGALGETAAFPPIRSGGGLVLALTLALYPYVYLLARNAFAGQSGRALEAARSLGESGWGSFWRVALPMARPWIATGITLASLETLADFGTVAVFNYDTFTVAIYKAWYGLFSLPAAAQLASLLVLLALLALTVEQRLRAKQRYGLSARGDMALRRLHLAGARKWAATGLAFAVVLAGFVIPVGQLLLWAVAVAPQDLDERFLGYLGNTVLLGGGGASLIVSAALLLAWLKRHYPSRLTNQMVRFATLGYALPGTVLAVGTYIPFAWLDERLTAFGERYFELDSGPWLAGGLFALLSAYGIRFLAVGFGAVDSAMQRISTAMEDSARVLGAVGFAMLRRVHLPLLRGGLASALLVTFVDLMKEMPITLLMRPFGWDTLAVRIFEMTAEGEWRRAALPSVLLVLLGVLPTLLLVKASQDR